MKTNAFGLNQRLLLVHSVALGMVSLIVPQYILFWQERGVVGLDASIAEGAFVVVAALASIPMGMVADKFGRKRVLTFGSLMMFLGFATYYTNYGFWEFMLSEGLIGIGCAAVGCTAQAMLVESVHLNGGSQLDKAAMTASLRNASYATFVLGAPLGGWLGTINSELPFLICAGAHLLAFCVSLFLKETASHESEEKARLGFKAMLDMRHRFFAGDLLSTLLLTSMALSGLFAAGHVLLQPYYQALGHTAFTLGISMAAGQTILIFMTDKISKIKGAAECHKLRSLSFCGLGLGYVLIATIQSPLVIVCGWLYCFTRAYHETVLSVAISEVVDNKERATVLGLRGFVDGLARVVVIIVGGWLSEFLGTAVVLYTAGILALGIALRAISRGGEEEEVI